MHTFTDPSQNFIQKAPQKLDAFFQAASIAVVGAKDDPSTVGRTLMNNLIEGGFPGSIYPVNPKRQTVMGIKCYPDLASLPEVPELVVVVTPAKSVPGIMQECAAKGTKACIIISAGFKEMGAAGEALEEETIRIARQAGISVIGPNCLGVMNPWKHLNATFASGMALPGHVAFISQSGAMCTSVLDWSLKEKIGFSAFVSIGSMADVEWGDLIDYLGNDPNTTSLLLYMETIGNPRKFLSAAREIALEKPIIVIKGGRSEQAAEAAASHTGSLAGSDAVFDAALERVGVLRVDSIAELFEMASVLARQPKPKGPKLAILTNAGGPGVLATDATVEGGAELATISGKALEQLNAFLPAAWSHSNPIDILGDADPDRFAKTIKVLADDPGIDGILVILTPQDMTNPLAAAQALVPYAQSTGKPLLASWMGGETVASGIACLNDAGIPTFEYPDAAAKAFGRMWKYSKNLHGLYQFPTLNAHSTMDAAPSKLAVQLLNQKKSLLDEYESKKVLEGYGIPTVKTEIAQSADEAVKEADQMGYPVVVKLYSSTITHKSDVGGVKLNLKNANDVKEAFNDIQGRISPKDFQGVTVQQMIRWDGYELILGCSVDPQFGPTLLFGLGGQLVEVFKDSALALPPLTPVLAEALMEKTKIYQALKGVRGRKPVDLEALKQVLVRFSLMISENPQIKECDINPLLVTPEGVIALDARFILDENKAQLAIRPYPAQYSYPVTLKNGTQLLIRPIKPEDESLLIDFHKALSADSVRQRFFEFVSLDQRIAHERLLRICFNDFDRELALVAEDPNTHRIAGVIRISRIPTTQNGILTMIIIDEYHHQGLGTLLMQKAIAVARQEGWQKISAFILDENKGMLHISEKAGFVLKKGEQPKIIEAHLGG